ncbi:baculoviral IAP repeat-containing protein 1f-like [Lingula anatina]|uniref:Baculoviral IAP repeat-containing protein 1f-like n=1 Tax=Lingula anatina TaxID=7574 RepID=A0A1S3I2S3_LINAN|nr:baculoviral IAP repeat-containing protein 1f-like [Lingula anatina]|eukprot:XP_013391649.1 baculoviral IAP repeat-containing protein 1f-like [Lingula anatina]
MARLLSGCFGSPDAKYMFEKERIASFRTWPGKAKCLPLASAGFSYTGSADEVICFSCRGRISNWKESDRPFQTHRFYFPHCKHVTGHDSGDVPLYDRLPQNEGNDPFPNLASGRTQRESNETDIRDPGQSSDSLTNDRCSLTPLLEQVYGHRPPCSDGMNAEGTSTKSTSFVLAEQQKEPEPSSERQVQLETPSDTREVINSQISGNQRLSKPHYQGGMPQPGLDYMAPNQHATSK